MMEKKKRFYLPQLDGLRFLAFFLVLIHHFPSAAHYFAPKSFPHFMLEKLSAFGWIGVDVFLCLSSFLLTSLLIMEHRDTGNISIKQFFIRRALRIWPFLPAGTAFTMAPFRYWLLGFIITFAMTVGLATLSYYGFEKHFLKLKTRFTIIQSRPA